MEAASELIKQLEKKVELCTLDDKRLKKDIEKLFTNVSHEVIDPQLGDLKETANEIALKAEQIKTESKNSLDKIKNLHKKELLPAMSKICDAAEKVDNNVQTAQESITESLSRFSKDIDNHVKDVKGSLSEALENLSNSVENSHLMLEQASQEFITSTTENTKECQEKYSELTKKSSKEFQENVLEIFSGIKNDLSGTLTDFKVLFNGLEERIDEANVKLVEELTDRISNEIRQEFSTSRKQVIVCFSVLVAVQLLILACLIFVQ